MAIKQSVYEMRRKKASKSSWKKSNFLAKPKKIEDFVCRRNEWINACYQAGGF